MLNRAGVLIVAVLVASILIAGCSQKNVPSLSSVKNPELKDEISHLNKEMVVRNLTENDTVRILAFSKDPVERFYAQEFAWLVLHNESDHYDHPLTFLDWYVRTGNESFCAPHEIGHMYVYIEANDTGFAESRFAVAKGKISLWETQQDKSRQRYPQYYQGLEELKAMINEVVPRLEQKDYGDETLTLLKAIDEKSVC